jgi:hypothetical protein
MRVNIYQGRFISQQYSLEFNDPIWAAIQSNSTLQDGQKKIKTKIKQIALVGLNLTSTYKVI